MAHFTKSGIALADAIRKAMDDHKITTSEYEEIINLVHADEKVDPHEQRLMNL
jgi:hypothetical protein